MKRVLTNENRASQVLDLALRREWNDTFFDATHPVKKLDLFNAYNMHPIGIYHNRNLVKKLFKKVPKTNTRMVKLVRNITEEEATVNTLRNAVNRGDANTVKKLYRPKFFFDLMAHTPLSANANVINAMIPPNTLSPNTLIGHLSSRTSIWPSTVAQVIRSQKIPMENLIKTIFKLSYDLRTLDIFKEFEKITKKRIDFSYIQEKDMISWFSRYSTRRKNRTEFNIFFEVGAILLQFMNDRGAPLIPMQLLLDCATTYMDDDKDNEWIDIPEFYMVLDMYSFREPVKIATIHKIFLFYIANTRGQTQNNNERMTGQLRVILDKIDIPKNILQQIPPRRRRKIPEDIVDYLVMRGASRI